MKVPEKYYDEIFEFKGQWDIPSKCGLKIREIDSKKFVIVTELYQENTGTSVTYAGFLLASQICQVKNLILDEITYIECTPDTKSKLSFYDEEYYEVKFNDGQPAYRLISQDEVNHLFQND